MCALVCLRRGVAEPWGGPDRRELLGELVDRLCGCFEAASPRSPRGSPTRQAVTERWLPLLREASKPGPVRCGCFAEVYARLRRSQGLYIPLLGAILRTTIDQGRHWGEQLCLMLLREAGELPVTGRLPDGRSIVEKALDLGWDAVALMLFDRGASLDSDLAAQARALRAAVEGGHRELAKRLVGQMAEDRDAWARPAAPEAREGGPAVLFDAGGRRVCGHFLCAACATELSLQSAAPRCPVCRQQFQPPPTRPPDPREDPAAWFAFFDEDGSGYLERQLLEKVLPAVVPVDASKLEDPAGEGRVSRKAFCAERLEILWDELFGSVGSRCQSGSQRPTARFCAARNAARYAAIYFCRYFCVFHKVENGLNDAGCFGTRSQIFVQMVAWRSISQNPDQDERTNFDAVETWPGSACRRLREPSKLMLRRSVGRFCDLYAALGVRPSATHGELRDAYLRLAKQHHPDVTNSSDNGVRFQRVQRAWETLRDPQQRLVYDSSSRFETGSMLRHAAAQRAASAAKKHASKNHWYEELRDAQRARTSQECEGEMKWKEEVFPSTHDERLRMQAQQFEKVMREVKSHPDFGQFVGAGLQMKLLCQLGFILAAMLNLLLWAYVKQQKSVASSTKPPSGMDRALRSIGISLR
ncbi:Chaperone protein DnaJ [Durusdinium trenchii]|uniref:Chaperone protein DnaJ n=1 Tax=Durusdinium trenchii TaxID=1381693 RepID=A0ABP0MFB0_9DINO